MYPAAAGFIVATSLLSFSSMLWGSRTPVHQCKQVAAESAFVGMTLKDLLCVFRVDRDFLPATVITTASELAVDSHFCAAAFYVERNPTFGDRSLQIGFGL